MSTVPGLCLQPLSCSRTPPRMCLLLLKLLPLLTGSVFWVERLAPVISGDDLPMEWALHNKHKAVMARRWNKQLKEGWNSQAL